MIHSLIVFAELIVTISTVADGVQYADRTLCSSSQLVRG